MTDTATVQVCGPKQNLRTPGNLSFFHWIIPIQWSPCGFISHPTHPVMCLVFSLVKVTGYAWGTWVPRSIFTVSMGRKFCECYLFSMRHTMIATPILEGGTLISVLFLSQLPIRSLNLESTLPPIDRSTFPGVPFSLDHTTLRYTLWNQSILSRILTTYRNTVLLGPFCSTLNQSKALRSHSGFRMDFFEVSYNFPEVL